MKEKYLSKLRSFHALRRNFLLILGFSLPPTKGERELSYFLDWRRRHPSLLGFLGHEPKNSVNVLVTQVMVQQAGRVLLEC